MVEVQNPIVFALHNSELARGRGFTLAAALTAAGCSVTLSEGGIYSSDVLDDIIVLGVDQVSVIVNTIVIVI